MSEITVTRADREMALLALFGDVGRRDLSSGWNDWVERGAGETTLGSVEDASLHISPTGMAQAIAQARAEGAEAERARCLGIVADWGQRLEGGKTALPAFACRMIASDIECGKAAYVAAVCEPDAALEGGERQ